MTSNFLLLGIGVIFYWLLLLLIDTGYPSYWMGVLLHHGSSQTDDSTLDADVLEEKKRIAKQMDGRDSFQSSCEFNIFLFIRKQTD